MSRVMDTSRQRQVLLTGGIAVLMVALVLVTGLMRASQDWQPELTGLVLPGWADEAETAARIDIDGPDGRFELLRQGGVWVMPSRDYHPVLPVRIAQLDAFLSGLTHAGARTRDPAKHARLGLAESGESGAGMRLTVQNEAGEVVADIILGVRNGDGIYLRNPGSARTYLGRLGEAADVPDIAAPSDWLDLDFLALGRTEIARTRIQPERGPAYVLERSGQATRNFALREPAGWRPITAGAGNGPGAALSRLRFRDVRRASRLSGDEIARHTAQTFTGLEVSLSVIAQGETRWARLDVRALTDDLAAEADALEELTEGWAYLLSDLSLDRLLRPLDEFADPRGDSDAP